MVQEHTPVNTQLQQLAIQKGVTLPTSTGEQNQQVKQRLSNLFGTKFDRKYMNHMVQDHEKDVYSFQREAQQGQDPDVKAFAAQTVPILQEHLQLARAIVNSNASASNSTAAPTRTP